MRMQKQRPKPRPRFLQLEYLEPRLALFSHDLVTVADLTVMASATSPPKPADVVKRFDGADGGTVSISTGTPVDTGNGLGDGSLVDVADSLSSALTTGDYQFRQIAPDAESEELIIEFSGDVTIRTQYVFRPTKIIGRYSGSTPPRLTVYAGQTLWVPPPAWQGDPATLVKSHSAIVDLSAKQSEVTSSAVSGGSFTFITTADGGVKLDVSANGSYGSDGGQGGKGGAVNVVANRQVEGGQGGRGPVAGVISAEGARSDTLFSYDGENHNVQPGRGGEGGVIVIAGSQVSASLWARGGWGGEGGDGLDTCDNAPGFSCDGSHHPPASEMDAGDGNDGGRGGIISIDFENLTSNRILATGGHGGRGGYGGSPGDYKFNDPFVTGGDGGRGGNGGAGGAIVLNGLTYFDQGGDGGSGGDGGAGSFHEVCPIFGNSGCFSDVGDGGRGGNGGTGGQAGSFNLETIVLPGKINAPANPSGPTEGGEFGQGGSWFGDEYKKGPDGQPGANSGAGSHPSTAALPEISPPPKAQWTVLVYAAGDDTGNWNFSDLLSSRPFSIEAEIVDSIASFEAVDLSNSSVNVVMQMDRIGDGFFTGNDSDKPIPTYQGSDWTDTRRGKIEFSGDKNRFASFLAPINATPNSKCVTECNTGSAAALEEFLRWGINAAPAENYALVVQGHGQGWRGFLHDETQGTDLLTPAELKAALLAAAPPNTIDLMVFETCATQTVELATELAGVVPLVVGPQSFTLIGRAPGGFRHDFWLRVLNSFALAPVQLGRAILDSFNGTTNGGLGDVFTASLVDTSQIATLNSQLASFATIAIDHATAADWAVLSSALGANACDCGTFGNLLSDSGVRDIKRYMAYVSGKLETQNEAIAEAARLVVAALESVVVESQFSGGLSIYLPDLDESLSSEYIMRYVFPEHPSPGAQSWVEFLMEIRSRSTARSLVREASLDWGSDPPAAQSLALVSTPFFVAGKLADGLDTDVLRFTATAGQSLALYFGARAQGTKVSVTDDQGTVVFAGSAGLDLSLAALVSFSRGGDYFLAISQTAGPVAVEGQPYSLRLQLGDSQSGGPSPSVGNGSQTAVHLLAGDSQTAVVNIQNSGGLPFRVTNVSLREGTTVALVPSTEYINVVLPPQEQTTIATSFAALDPGVFFDTLYVATDAPSQPMLTIPLQFIVHDKLAPWRNTKDPHDVNADGFVAPSDVLTVINDINAFRSRLLAPPPAGPLTAPFLDVTGDNFVAANDVLTIVNFINARRFTQTLEGEGASTSPHGSAAIDEQLLALIALDVAVPQKRRR